MGDIWIRFGREIIIDAKEDSEPALLRLCILGPGFAVLLHQRNYLILHASAVSVEGEAVIFLGNSGDGKSTMSDRIASI